MKSATPVRRVMAPRCQKTDMTRVKLLGISRCRNPSAGPSDPSLGLDNRTVLDLDAEEGDL